MKRVVVIALEQPPLSMYDPVSAAHRSAHGSDRLSIAVVECVVESIVNEASSDLLAANRMDLSNER